MTNEQALAYAEYQLKYYKQVERDGVRMTTNLEFYEIVVNALRDFIDRSVKQDAS